MRKRGVGAVLESVRTLLEVGTSTGLSDDQLLERYLLRVDDAAEAAFRVLVERHGPMVLRTCRGVLHDIHAAEDAFQATFLILARKARSIRKRDSIASWLFGVARRVAGRSEVQRKRRATHERQVVAMARATVGSSDRAPEPIPEVQEEVDRLPERYWAPIVLCYLEGLTQEEAASRLHLPASTVRVRLMRARSRLRDRLIRRGLAPALLAGLSTRRAQAAIPTPLVDQTLEAAIRIAVGRTAGVSAPVAALVERVIRAMFFAQLKTAAAMLAALTIASLLMISSLAGPAPPVQGPAPVKDQAAADRPKPKAEGPQVTVATASRSRLKRSTNQTGTVNAFESVDVFARVSGSVKTLRVDIGSRVKKGEILAELDEPELAVAVEKARAEVGRAKVRVEKATAAMHVSQAAVKVEESKIVASDTALDEAEAKVQAPKRQLDRVRELAKSNAVGQNAVDEKADQYATAQSGSRLARAQRDVARATLVEALEKLGAAKADVVEAMSEVRIAEAGLKSSEIVAGYTKIVAPFDGIVTRRNYHAGAFIRSANMGNVDPIVTIVRTDLMRVVVAVPDSDVPYLDEGDPTTVRIDALGARGVFQGRIVRTAYGLDPLSRTLHAEIDLPNTDGRLRPGQRGRVEIDLETPENVLTIPSTAIAERGAAAGMSVCYRVVAGRAVRTPIKSGDDDGRRVEVLEGLKEGDVVIANPAARMSDGQAVTIRRDGHESTAP
jgi:HlyD family secretion protein